MMKNAMRFATLAGLILGLCCSAVAANAQTVDPASVINAWLAAENAHDVDAGVASFTNDAVLNLPTGVLSSPDAIRAYLQGETTSHSNAALEQGTLQVNANRVSYRVSRSADNWRQLGIDALEVNVEAVVQGGKIQSLTVTLPPDSAARLKAAMAQTTSPAVQLPATLPRTGDSAQSPLIPLIPLIALGAGLMILGSLLMRRRASP